MSTEDRKEEIKRLLEECNSYHYSQSSKFSSLARTIVLGVISTIWIISYSNNGFLLKNGWLLASLIASFVYLAVDIYHYFSDAWFYRNEYFRFEREQDKDSSVIEHNCRLRERSIKSFHSIIIKFIILFIVCSIFIIGFCVQMV